MQQAFAALLPAFEINPMTGVNGVADTLTVTGHGLATGDTLTYSKGKDDETIGALVERLNVLRAGGRRQHHPAVRIARGRAERRQRDQPRADQRRRQQPYSAARPASCSCRPDQLGSGGTADGAVGAAAAVAVNLDFNTALAGIIAGANITSTGAVTVTSQMDSDANAFATGQAVDSTTSLGIAAAANITSQSNQAFIAGTVTAPSIDVHALLGGNGVADFTANAISAAAVAPTSAWPVHSLSI